MSKIARATQKQFAGTATTNQLSQFGSLAAGTPLRYDATSVTPALIQTLANFLSGWPGAVIGGNSPAMEDLNSVCYLFAYQLSYIFQQGIPEWDSGTTYFQGSIVQDGSGNTYISLTNTNLNNALSSAVNWALGPRNTGSIRTVTANDVATTADYFIRVNNGASAQTETLPAVASTPVGFSLTIKRLTTSSANVTVQGHSAELIDAANTFILEFAGDSLTIINNGTSWDII